VVENASAVNRAQAMFRCIFLVRKFSNWNRFPYGKLTYGACTKPQEAYTESPHSGLGVGANSPEGWVELTRIYETIRKFKMTESPFGCVLAEKLGASWRKKKYSSGVPRCLYCQPDNNYEKTENDIGGLVTHIMYVPSYLFVVYW
jgi:hypothetical protein